MVYLDLYERMTCLSLREAINACFKQFWGCCPLLLHHIRMNHAVVFATVDT